ncbi:Cof-type HAD-IIB family hydrolase [soil metagenome]|nr:HAD family hydrolase [Trueperaceae bacterium]
MLLAFDLDRTLVTDDYQLLDRTADAVTAARRAGHHVTVLTGRARAAAQPYLDRLEVVGPCSVNHGAVVLGAGGVTLRRTQLSAEDVIALLAPYVDQHLLEFSCVVDDTLYVRDPEHDHWKNALTQNRLVERFSSDYAHLTDKVVFAPSESCAHVSEHVGRILPHLTRYLWGDGFLEVIGAGADKGTALALIAEQLGVPRHEVVAFGDGLNDVTMLQWAGHGVAVGSAHVDTLAVADEHIPSPEEGGVAAWIERHAL